MIGMSTHSVRNDGNDERLSRSPRSSTQGVTPEPSIVARRRSSKLPTRWITTQTYENLMSNQRSNKERTKNIVSLTRVDALIFRDIVTIKKLRSSDDNKGFSSFTHHSYAIYVR